MESTCRENCVETFFEIAVGRLIRFIAIFMGLFHIYVACFGVLAPGIPHEMSFIGMHLLLAMLIWYLKSIKKSKILAERILHALMACVSTGILLYYFFNYPDIKNLEGAWSDNQKTAGLVLMALLLYMCWRAMGAAIPVLCGIFLTYSYFGRYFPPLIAHRGVDVLQMGAKLFLHIDGIFGTPLQSSAKFVFLFILFSAFLNVSGAAGFIVDFALGLFGRTRGGPAKAAVVSSALLGTISGSVISNVVGTGTFTIPLMKKTGYSDVYAGAVEAAASTGGQIMPPIMGAAAFIMAEMLGISYMRVVYVAIVPAILYFLSILFQVDLQAKKQLLGEVKKQELPDLRKVLKNGWYQFFPLLVVVYMILSGNSLMRAAFYGISSTLAVSWLFGGKEFRMTPRKIAQALEEGAMQGVEAAVLCGTLGVVVGCVLMTGLSSKLATVLVTLAGGHKLLLLVLIMLASIVMGMGLPTTGCYILLAVMVCPALIEMGITPLLAHLFVFYFGILSAITPPVAIGAFAAAAISKGDPMKTGFMAWRLALVGFVVPFFFIYSPALALIGDPLVIAMAVVSSLIGVYMLAVALEGIAFTLTNPIQRILFGAAGFLAIDPGLVTDAIALALIAVAGSWNYSQYKSKKSAA